MRELHVVAVSEDGRHVVLAGRRGTAQGGFRVAIDDRLAAAVRGDLRQPGSDAPPSSDLSPKEIQARLRTGESAQSIALAAGVPVARVQRFSGPVQGEMARVIDACRTSYFSRGRLGRSAVALGAAVDAALAAQPTLVEDSVDWSTYREESGSWLVTVSWVARRRTRQASWRYDPAAKLVTAADPASAALAHVEAVAEPAPRRRAATSSTRTAVTVTKAPARKAPVTKAPAVKAPAKKAPAVRAPAKKGPAVRAPAKKGPAVRAPAKKGPAVRAPAKKGPAVRAPAKKAPAVKAPAKKAPAVKAPVKQAPAKKAARLRVVPDPAPTAPTRTRASTTSTTSTRSSKTTGPAKRTSANERDGVKTRATVPGWADVLLGTTPGGDR